MQIYVQTDFGTMQTHVCAHLARSQTVRLALPVRSLQISRSHRHRSLQVRCLSMQAAARTQAGSKNLGQQQASLLTDAHCHPQLDPANMQALLQLQNSKLAAMSVGYDVDWNIMLQLHKLAGARSFRWQHVVITMHASLQ